MCSHRIEYNRKRNAIQLSGRKMTKELMVLTSHYVRHTYENNLYN